MSEQNPDDLKAVLLIDDSVTDIRAMTEVIEAAGYEVTTAADGDDGAALLVSQKWAFVVVDLLIPGKDGVEVIQIGRKEHPDLQIMIVSASSNASLIDAAFRAGADYHLSKPIEPKELLNQVKGRSRVSEAVPEDVPETDPEAVPGAQAEAVHTPTVVAVGACPGDVEMGCGGVLSKHHREGHKIVIVNLAGGGDPQSPLAASANLAADVLEAQMENIGEETSGDVDLERATSTLKKVFEDSKPGILYLPSASSDRASSVESHGVALSLAEEIPNILAYQDPGATMNFRPQFFVDLAPEIKRKLELVGLYDKLELKNVGTDIANATALFWGRFADPTLVEPLEVIRQGSG